MAHRDPDDPRLRMMSCPECGANMRGPAGLSAHRRARHGVHKGGTAPPRVSPPARVERPVVTTEPNADELDAIKEVVDAVAFLRGRPADELFVEMVNDWIEGQLADEHVRVVVEARRAHKENLNA